MTSEYTWLKRGSVQERRGCANESGASMRSDRINTVIRAVAQGRASEEDHPAHTGILWKRSQCPLWRCACACSDMSAWEPLCCSVSLWFVRWHSQTWSWVSSEGKGQGVRPHAACHFLTGEGKKIRSESISASLTTDLANRTRCLGWALIAILVNKYVRKCTHTYTHNITHYITSEPLLVGAKQTGSVVSPMSAPLEVRGQWLSDSCALRESERKITAPTLKILEIHHKQQSSIDC